MIPEYPVTSISQAFHALTNASGVHASEFHSISPCIDQFASTHLIIGENCEKAVHCSWTGKAGDMITVKVKSANGIIDAA